MQFHEQICINCHFLRLKYRVPRQDRIQERPVTHKERELICKEDYSWLRTLIDPSLGCHFRVWDDKHSHDLGEYRHEVIVKTKRKNTCFFWKYHPGMLFQAAKTLQKREADYREASRDRKLTIIGLFIAVIALVVNSCISLIDLLIDITNLLQPRP